MKIHFHISLNDIDRSKRYVTMDLPEGINVMNALESYGERYGIPYSIAKERGVAMFVNNEPAKISKVLAPEDTIRVIKPMVGG